MAFLIMASYNVTVFLYGNTELRLPYLKDLLKILQFVLKLSLLLPGQVSLLTHTTKSLSELIIVRLYLQREKDEISMNSTSLTQLNIQNCYFNKEPQCYWPDISRWTFNYAYNKKYNSWLSVSARIHFTIDHKNLLYGECGSKQYFLKHHSSFW